MASVQTGRDLPEAKWKECDVVGLLELLFQVATVKDLFLIIAVWNTSMKDVQKADAAGWALLASAWLLPPAWAHKVGAAQSPGRSGENTAWRPLVAGQLF